MSSEELVLLIITSLKNEKEALIKVEGSGGANILRATIIEGGSIIEREVIIIS